MHYAYVTVFKFGAPIFDQMWEGAQIWLLQNLKSSTSPHRQPPVKNSEYRHYLASVTKCCHFHPTQD